MACIKSMVMKVKLVMFERRKKNKQKDGNKIPSLNSNLKQLFKLKNFLRSLNNKLKEGFHSTMSYLLSK
jgi:hypothetical protein